MLRPTIDDVRAAVKKTGITLVAGCYGTRFLGCILTALYYADDQPLHDHVDDIRTWATERFGYDYMVGLIAGFDTGFTWGRGDFGDGKMFGAECRELINKRGDT